ncbi:sugar diacid recognition domain-containing protein [Motilimonas sp. E26]|uniref:sugar diacid recognition domain-containing protein n=1 Tax=Motilimonas TaxID=1914248 RepID=UPI001E3FC90B|nr:sugar diacid recognition domain-containing protein [Motilimonas sp. E26]MCE0556337.1 helix-turn-helix domain-containing protein [Motilimonas sp. E26]
MYIFDPRLAQQIVDRTMDIIGFNINVMNAKGVILASGDTQRINTVHEGALLAIANGRTVEIDLETANNLVGVKPGINLTLSFAGDVIGVVGITGEPDAIRNYGKLVKMTAEMIVEQAALLEKLQWDRRHKEEFIVQWVKGQLSHEQCLDWAQRLGIDIYMPRVAAVIELNASQGQGVSTQTIRRVIELLEYPARDNLVAMLSMSELVVLKPAFLAEQQWQPELERQRISALLQRIEQEQTIQINVGLGHFFDTSNGVSRIPLSYQSALQTLAVGKQLQPDQQQYLYHDLSLPVLVSALAEDWRGQELIKPYQMLRQQDKSGQLEKTLKAYFTHFGDLNACATSLFVHRNTLRYRLDKIIQITGLDLQSLDGLVQLYLASTVAQVCDLKHK